MIELCVEDYCQNGCSCFEPEVESILAPEYYGDTRVNKYIYCKKRGSCRLIKEYLERTKRYDKDSL